MPAAAGGWEKDQQSLAPQVIDFAALRDGVHLSAEDYRNEDEKIGVEDWGKAKLLKLSYKNIAEISNLNNFDSLEVLKLDNNIISRMEGLDKLINLKWLDLSFNNIREIHGLENLVHLEDLSLYHNHIETINWDAIKNCKKMNIISLGRNRIRDIKQVRRGS
jgi:hypothetical protein